MKERVTILMPVYNGEEFLKETIGNVLQQTYRDFVFLIINDGSTDTSEDIILSFSDLRIFYIKNEFNKGLVHTLNCGIELVKTEYLARMDADDLWDETKLEKQLKVLDQRPEIGVCGTSIRKFGKYEADFIFPQRNDELKVGFLFYCCMSHPSVVFRMSFLEKSGLRYRNDYFPAEDYKMWVDALNFTQLYNIPEILVYYRQHGNQITQDSNTVQFFMTNKVKLELINSLSEYFTKDELDFHLERFLQSNINDSTSYYQAKKWIRKLVDLNKTKRLFNKKIFGQRLTKQLHSSYYSYVRQKYFIRKKLILAYVVSGEWVRIGLKYNIKLLLHR